MARLAIFTSEEWRLFELPPLFNSVDRKRFFSFRKVCWKKQSGYFLTNRQLVYQIRKLRKQNTYSATASPMKQLNILYPVYRKDSHFKCDILLHNSDLLLKKSAKNNIDPGAVTIQGKPRSSKVVEKFG